MGEFQHGGPELGEIKVREVGVRAALVCSARPCVPAGALTGARDARGRTRGTPGFLGRVRRWFALGLTRISTPARTLGRWCACMCICARICERHIRTVL
jgi:hypothetical protein